MVLTVSSAYIYTAGMVGISSPGSGLKLWESGSLLEGHDNYRRGNYFLNVGRLGLDVRLGFEFSSPKR